MAALVFVGIDVSQDQLDVAIRPGSTFTVASDDEGVTALVTRLQTVRPTLIVLEATGGLEAPLLGALAVTGLPVVALNPRQVRAFARATGQLAKTDRVDAQVLAQFAEAMRPPVRPMPDAQTHALSALVTRWRQLRGMLTAEKNRVRLAPLAIHPRLQAHITWLKHELATTDTELLKAIRESSVWRDKDDVLHSAPGVGPVLVSTFFAH